MEEKIEELAIIVNKRGPLDDHFWKLSNELLSGLAQQRNMGLFPLSAIIMRYCKQHGLGAKQVCEKLNEFALLAFESALAHIEKMGCDALCDRCTLHNEKVPASGDEFAQKAHLN